MRFYFLLIVFILNSGCTTMRPIEATPAELRHGISCGALLEIGDRVSIITSDDQTHRFAVAGVDAGFIEGKTESVPIDQVVHVEKRQFSRGKTAALVGGILAGAALGLVIYGLANFGGSFALR